MIHFALVCDDGHAFEGWFRNAGDFDAQAGAGYLTCPVCGGTEVRKALMAPNVSTSRKKVEAEGDVQAPSANVVEPVGGSREGQVNVSRTITENTPSTPSAMLPATLAVSDPRQGAIVEVLRKLRDTVIQNTDDVGKGFAEEARKMHYGEAEKRGIRGETSPQEVRELSEEGIDVMPLPALPEDKN